jgi:hypothetical protein
VAGVAVLGAALTGWLARGGPVAPPTFRPLTHERGTLSTARFIPNTSEVIYSARWGVQPEQWYTRKLDQPGAQTVPGSGGPILSVTREGEVLALTEAYLTHGQLYPSKAAAPGSGPRAPGAATKGIAAGTWPASLAPTARKSASSGR